MHRSWRRLLARLTDALPEARYEAVLALLRTCLLLAGGVILAISSVSADDLALPMAVNVVLASASLAVAVVVSGSDSARTTRAWGAWSTLADVLLFAGYSVAFGDRPGAGGLYGVFVLLVGPLRYGALGVLATVVPVGAIAIGWPQLDVNGASPAVPARRSGAR